jgi:predicted aspartyl protease
MVVKGEVTSDGEVVASIEIAGRTRRAVIDTGFTGDLQLPGDLFESLNPTFRGKVESVLANGEIIEKDIFLVDFAFDNQIIVAESSFGTSEVILIGTRLLHSHRLEVNFHVRSVLLERVN